MKKSNNLDQTYSKKKIDAEIIQNSVKYQILCEKTAFIAVIQYNELSEKDK